MEKRAFLLREMIDQQEVTSALLVLRRSPCDSTTAKVIPLEFRFRSTKNNVFKPEQYTLNSHRNSFESLFSDRPQKVFNAQISYRSAMAFYWVRFKRKRKRNNVLPNGISTSMIAWQSEILNLPLSVKPGRKKIILSKHKFQN